MLKLSTSRHPPIPQIAPLGWFTLFTLFIIALVLFNVINYFAHIPSGSGSGKESELGIKSYT
jgi:hypothetical protein